MGSGTSKTKVQHSDLPTNHSNQNGHAPSTSATKSSVKHKQTQTGLSGTEIEELLKLRNAQNAKKDDESANILELSPEEEDNDGYQGDEKQNGGIGVVAVSKAPVIDEDNEVGFILKQLQEHISML